MELNKTYLSELVIGIRYSRHFRIREKIGSMIDKILFDKTSPFSSDFFPKYKEFSSDYLNLFDETTENSLQINSSDIIFRLKLIKDKEEKISWFKDQAILFIVEEILKKYEITNINRIGIQFIHTIKAKDVGTSVIKKIVGKDSPKLEQFSISFGHKIPTNASLLKSTNDYINVITKVTHTSEQSYDVLMDYQYFFKPISNKLSKFSITSFFEKGEKYLDKEFYPLISKFIPELLEEN